MTLCVSMSACSCSHYYVIERQVRHAGQRRFVGRGRYGTVHGAETLSAAISGILRHGCCG